MARMSAAGIFPDEIAGAIQETDELFVSIIKLGFQRLPDDFGFRPVQCARPVVQPLRKIVR